MPDGDTVLQPGDEIIAIIGQDSEPAMRELVGGPDIEVRDPEALP